MNQCIWAIKPVWMLRTNRSGCFGHLGAAISHIRTLQDLLGHKNVMTTQIYTHVMQKPGLGVRSPMDVI